MPNNRSRSASCSPSVSESSPNGSSTSEAQITARAAASGRRAHHRCNVDGCPCRIDFSRAASALIAANGNDTSISFGLYPVTPAHRTNPARARYPTLHPLRASTRSPIPACPRRGPADNDRHSRCTSPPDHDSEYVLRLALHSFDGLCRVIKVSRNRCPRHSPSPPAGILSVVRALHLCKLLPRRHRLGQAKPITSGGWLERRVRHPPPPDDRRHLLAAARGRA